MSSLVRRSHFLGAKIRGVRKSNGLTLQDLSARCIQADAENAPSVSYLSMIERGKRIPSEAVLGLLAAVFQREPQWFLDENTQLETNRRNKTSPGAARIPLEPGFLFSKDLLETAIPELLSQTGTTGRQFAHLLIRSYQETHRNEFPDLERSAEEVGEKRFPLSARDLIDLCKRLELEIHWFDRDPLLAQDQDGSVRTFVRSFFDAPSKIYINRKLQDDPARLKYDLATHIGHKVLHNGDGLKSVHTTGGPVGGIAENVAPSTGGLDSEDVLYAWRDFECSFFAGALLCPKQEFRRFLMREGYAIAAGNRVELTPAVVMRRMTTVSPYRHWHYFDAYPPGYLRAVYRGNGIPLPWGNMAMVTDPCPSWAVFDMLRRPSSRKPRSQISVLRDAGRVLLYCCHSLRTKDLAGNAHVLSVGVDLEPALASQGFDAEEIVADVAAAASRGETEIPARCADAIRTAGHVLSIGWISESVQNPASIICPRSTACPRSKRCENVAVAQPAAKLSGIRDEIIRDLEQMGT
jgi:transcriptional regulator with XRE-family HTH domain